MPLFVGASSKAMPRIGIEYITDESKTEVTTVQNLDSGRDLADQFTATAKLHGHYTETKERKYYHFKLSPDPTDNAEVVTCHALGEQLAAELFKGHECVISTHTDTSIVHTHIIVNAVNFETGKKMNIRNHEYGKMKDRANELGAEHGMSVIDFRNRAKQVLAPEAMQDLREVIDETKFLATNMTDFKAHLRKYDVVVRETKNTISYLHPKRKRPIRGDKIGEQYTKGAILDAIDKQRDRRAATRSGAISADSRGQQKGTRKYIAQTKPVGKHGTGNRKVGDVEREIQSINDGVRQLTPAGKRKRKRLEGEIGRESVRTPELEPTVRKKHRQKDKGIER